MLAEKNKVEKSPFNSQFYYTIIFLISDYVHMIEKITSFHLIYRSTFSVIWLLRYEGKTSTTHPPVLSNLKTSV